FAAYLTEVLQPAITVLRTRRVLSAMFNSTYRPLLPSISRPVGQPRIAELKIDIPEFLLICAPARKRLLPLLLSVANGPMAVMLLNTAAVCGSRFDPLASLSLSNASELERSAINESRMINPN